MKKLIGMKHKYGMGSSTRIWIGHDYCRVVDGKNFGFEIMEVLLGPLNLNPDKDDSVLSV